LVFASLVLAILIEVLPTEADLLSVAAMSKDVPLFLAIKAACLLAICLPLVLYVGLHGRRGVKAAKGRLTALGIIVAAKLALDTLGLLSVLLRTT
jgi:hypothetical protein